MNIKRIFILALIVSTCLSFNTFGMNNDSYFPKMASPSTEEKHDDLSLDYRWIWVNDELCLRSKTSEGYSKDGLSKMWEMGVVSLWSENGKAKTRDSYSGKWSQDDSGIWSFVFDDYTIPVGVTKIDDVLYAFTGYGELKEGYEYYEGLKTGADGLVVTDNADLNKWLETEYLPSCTSHKE